MLVIRPIEPKDFDALYRFAEISGAGFTSLPVDTDLLQKRLTNSIQSFAKPHDQPISDEGYLLVGEEIETGQVVGVTGIEANIGYDTPFYSYHMSQLVNESAQLGVRNVHNILTLTTNFVGCTEVCTLYLDPDFRKNTYGRLLSKSRFMMMAQYPDRFAKTVFAEMRGKTADDGISPFWHWLEKHFFSIDFQHADHLTGLGHKQFIVDLMPKLPIYVSLLSKEAQSVIGEVHENTEPAKHLLEKEGFTFRGYVDIFDAGPTIDCELKQLETVRCSKLASVKVAEHSSSTSFLLSNTSFSHFRATIANAFYCSEEKCITLSPKVAQALQVSTGEFVRILAQ